MKDLASVDEQFHQDNLCYQENMEQHRQAVNKSFQNIGTLSSQINANLDNLINEQEFIMTVHRDQEKNAIVITFKGVEEEKYWSKSENEVKISPSESEVITVEVHEEEEAENKV
ncbi:hypothetical protein Scep_016875 [Stephania cephalantha]|uniref:Uncharacterized protein n=1 Tax=Stephania cephalantha TaxID=152367 RepID=A0AAP0INM8_9MAGN